DVRRLADPAVPGVPVRSAVPGQGLRHHRHQVTRPDRPHAPAPRPRPVPGGSPMTTRYAVIGTGHRAQMYLDAIAGPHADLAQLVALIDSNPARREYCRGRFEQFADAESAGPEQLEELIERLAVDRVIVTSPDRLHAEHVVRVLDAGADVIVEKPLTIDAPSARRIQ